MSQSLAQLAPHSRVWVFQSDRFLNSHEIDFIQQNMSVFIPQWASHGNDLYGGFTIEKDLFLVVAVDEARSPASGCSIDSLTRTVKALGEELKIDFFNRMAIAYEGQNGKIDLISMNEFKQKITAGQVTEDTMVYNNLINSKLEFETKWRTEVKNSWHTNLFQIA